MTQIPLKPEFISKVSSPGISREKTADAAPSGAFSKILAAQLQQPLDAAAEIPGLPELSAGFSLSRLNALNDRTTAANEISQVLDGLDTYVQWLADPEKTLREASGLLEELAAGIADLESRVDGASEQKLKDILSHMSTLVAVEKTKLDRGDYL